MKPQTVGILGLGAMGQGICYRLRNANVQLYGFDTNEQALQTAQQIGVKTVNSLEELAQTCSIIWLMLPASAVNDSIIILAHHMAAKSIVIDGGNSNFHDSINNAQLLAKHTIFFLDCGTSGGLAGKERGYCCMIGGDQEVFKICEFIFKAVAAPHGYLYCGPSGAGHYVKMIHNGIEYALLQSYAEGFQLLQEGSYKNFDLAALANLWNHGSIIRSYILELMHKVLTEHTNFSSISGKVDYTGMGQWTVEEAQSQKIPVPLIENALKIRQESQITGGTTATKLVALLRNAFGGHKVHKKEKNSSCS